MANVRKRVRRRSFTHVLVYDVNAAQERVRDADSPTHRRDLVRSVFAAIEGLHWQLKQDVYQHAGRIPGGMTVHEQAAMLEEAYAVDDSGKIRAIPRFLPLTSKIRLVVSIVQRYRTNYKVDYSHRGWSNLRAAIKVRNRLVHPKKLADLNVRMTELRQTLSAFYWFLALVIEVLRETLQYSKEVAARVKTAKAGQLVLDV
jgi:hypothetical protein